MSIHLTLVQFTKLLLILILIHINHFLYLDLSRDKKNDNKYIGNKLISMYM